MKPDDENPHAADAVLERPNARCALWWRHTPAVPGETTGCLGDYAAGARDAGVAILSEGCRGLARHGVTRVLAPMNGNTWRSHRLMVESDGRPPFFMEPENPPGRIDEFRAAGFRECAFYSSSEVLLDEDPEPPLEPTAERLAGLGVTFRPLDPERYRGELRAIHELSLESFAANFLYTPLAEADFLAAYEPLRDKLDPRLVQVAEQHGELAGFLFALPDLRAAAEGRAPDLILKTLAVRPRRELSGLGSVLVARIHAAGRALGFRRAIHALQHESNRSLRLSARFGARPFRRYALFSKSLAP